MNSAMCGVILFILLTGHHIQGKDERMILVKNNPLQSELDQLACFKVC